MKKISGIILLFALTAFSLPLLAAKKEVPKSLPGITVISESKAVNMVFKQNCIEKKSCIFIDPRKTKDYKKGVIPGSVLYTFKNAKGFDAKKFIKAANKKGYSLKSLKDLKKIDILSACNGKFCPRSGNLLSFLRTKLGNAKYYWVRNEGVPGMLRLNK